jgi:hypothetical protein
MSFILYAVRMVGPIDKATVWRKDGQTVTFADPVFATREAAEEWCNKLNCFPGMPEHRVFVVTVGVDG